MTTENKNDGPTDPAARTRVIVGGLLLALAWLLGAAVVVVLLLVLPDQHVRDYAWAVVTAGLVAAGGATYALVDEVR